MKNSGDDWGGDNDPWPDEAHEEKVIAKAIQRKYRPVVLRPSKVREIVRKCSDKRVASDFVELLDQMVVIAIERLSAIHDGGAKTLSARLLAACPLRAAPNALTADSTLQRRRKRRITVGSVKPETKTSDSNRAIRKTVPAQSATRLIKTAKKKIHPQKSESPQAELFPV